MHWSGSFLAHRDVLAALIYWRCTSTSHIAVILVVKTLWGLDKLRFVVLSTWAYARNGCVWLLDTLVSFHQQALWLHASRFNDTTGASVSVVTEIVLIWMEVVFWTTWLQIFLFHPVYLMERRLDIPRRHLRREILVIPMTFLAVGHNVAACHIQMIASAISLHFKLTTPNWW